MTISFIGADSANATSITIPAHQQWDLLVMWVFRNAVTTPSTIPSGWRVVNYNGGSSNMLVCAVRVAQSASEVSGTWTSADHLAIGVYRSDTNLLSLNNAAFISGTIGSGGNVTYPVVTAVSPVTNKWLLGGFGHRSIDTDIQVAPTGMTNRTSVVHASAGEMGFHDTNGNYTSWSNTNYTLTAGTSSGYKASMAELTETSILLSSLAGGGGPSVAPGRLIR